MDTTPRCDDGIKNGAETDVDCGGGACRACTTGQGCAAPTDCESGFCEPNVKQCIAPGAETDCLDGIDNNGDGLADCQDPTCAALTGCVPSGPGGSQIGVVQASCPPGFGPATKINDGFQDTTCGGCTCATTPMCSTRVSLQGSAGCGGINQVLTPTGLATGGPVGCTAADGRGYVQFYVFPPDTVGRNCAVGGTVTRADPDFTTKTAFCPVQVTSATCGTNEVCAPKPPAQAQSMCVTLPGSVSCPSGYQASAPKTYYAGASRGACGTCPASCDAAPSRYCSYAHGYVFTCSGCSGASYDHDENECANISATPTAILSVSSAFAAAGADDCNVNQPATTPSTLIGQSTVCCR